MRLARDVEPYRLDVLEDPVAPEASEWLRLLRQETVTPVAMDEPFVRQREIVPLVRERLIDVLRGYISAIGGVTPARNVAALCEFFGVRTAWHDPGDVSPVGHAANLHLDLACPTFGIREAHIFGERTREVFPGCPGIRDGALWANGRPGWGIEIDEAMAAAHPFPDDSLNGGWPEIRLADGTVARP